MGGGPGPSMRTWAHQCARRPLWCARGPSNSHVNPLIRDWAAPTTLSISGLRATERVTARNSGFAGKSAHLAVADSPKTETTSLRAARFQCFSPRWSVFWAPRPLEQRPHRRQSGEMRHARVRHAVRGVRMAQNPHCSQPEVCRIAYKSWSQHRSARKNSPSTAPPAALPRQNSPNRPQNPNFRPF